MSDDKKGRTGCHQATPNKNNMRSHHYTPSHTPRSHGYSPSTPLDHYGFAQAIEDFGLQPPANFKIGKFMRLRDLTKRKNNKDGFCILFDSGHGLYGSHLRNERHVFHHNRNKNLTQSDRARLKLEIKQSAQQAEEERRKAQQDAAIKANQLWFKAQKASPNHPYLQRKGIQPSGAKAHGGSLLLAITDFRGNITSLQYIDASGKKRFLTDGRKKGCFIHVAGSLHKSTQVIIAEGFATAATISEHDPGALVIAALDAGNLKPVALNARTCWPHAKIIVAGDDDRLTEGNPGATKANEAARAADALVAIPQWPANAPEHLTDFNDLHFWLNGGLQ